jgi:hypothetical protein
VQFHPGNRKGRRRKNIDGTMHVFPECLVYSSPSGRLFSTSSGLTGFVLVPKIKHGGDDDSYPEASEKKPAVGWEPEQQDKHQCGGDNQAYAASQNASVRFRFRIPFHANTQTLSYPKIDGGQASRPSDRAGTPGLHQSVQSAQRKRPVCTGLA